MIERLERAELDGWIESIRPIDAQMALQAYRELIAGSCDIQIEPGLTVHEASEKYFRFCRERMFRQAARRKAPRD